MKNRVTQVFEFVFMRLRNNFLMLNISRLRFTGGNSHETHLFKLQV